MSAPDPPRTPPGAVRWYEGMDLAELPEGQVIWVPPGLVGPPIYDPGPPPNMISLAGRRLYWTLQGPLASSAISVMAEDLNPDGQRELYYRPHEPAATAWHPISQESIMEQPVTSLTVTEYNLDYWQDGWYDLNIEPNSDILDADADYFPGMPPKFDPVVVSASNGQFVTVHDYLSALHPWLMDHRMLILRAKYELIDESFVPDPDQKMLVWPGEVCVFADVEEEWLDRLRLNFEQQRQEQREQQQIAG
ncbi:hypothetical protein MAPG_06180 [Magnaporthiopsis poae ATCC 64411]|uniref:Uncharacterized protein n=1 Tax=Magnaporthiopsis poae (strain ATCC 64411 / 73-15) TaxID=644358 RepID=A0A0C4E1C2_MAGP6|nr:hypothetical protein MAPG_06180 [Magnaporthiopsis poae ATCC 64411]